MELVPERAGSLPFVTSKWRATATPAAVAAPELQNDRDVVLASVRRDGQALQWASEALRSSDKEVALAAVREAGSKARMHLQGPLRVDREVCDAAVERDLEV